MDAKSIIMMIVWLAVIGLVVVVASRVAGKAVGKAGV